MSDFAPGFTGQLRVAEKVLLRDSHDPARFVAAGVANIGRRPAPPEPRHFAPADRRANPTEGWDPFDVEVPVDAPAREDFIDPIAAAREAGFAAGHAAALAEIDAVRAEETALADQLSAALAQGAHFDRDRMAAQLRQTVMHLVTRLVGESGVAPDLLAARIGAAIELLAEGTESALLRLHPGDVALVQDKLPACVFPVGDPNLARGAFVIESASTIVEDGPDLWLEQLAQAIDRVPIPPSC